MGNNQNIRGIVISPKLKIRFNGGVNVSINYAYESEELARYLLYWDKVSLFYFDELIPPFEKIPDYQCETDFIKAEEQISLSLQELERAMKDKKIQMLKSSIVAIIAIPMSSFLTQIPDTWLGETLSQAIPGVTNSLTGMLGFNVIKLILEKNDNLPRESRGFEYALKVRNQLN